MCQQTGVIIGALNFTETLHDSKTIPAVLEQYERINNKEAKTVFADRGYKGIKVYKATNIHTPLPNKNITELQRKSHCKRAAIEPVISHLKHDYRMGRNFSKGITGDAINILLAAAAMNFKRVMNLWKKEANLCWQLFCKLLVNVYWNYIALKLKRAF